MNLTQTENSKSFGIVGGLGAFGGADVLLKLIKALPEFNDAKKSDVFYEQHIFSESDAVADDKFNSSSRKFYVFDTIQKMEQRGIDYVLLPCFISHSFISEIQPEIKAEIVNIMEALTVFINENYPDAKKIGILTSNFVKNRKLFEHYFNNDTIELIYPSSTIQNDVLMKAIYGTDGIKAGRLKGNAINLVSKACKHLEELGADIIIPGFTEIPVIIESLTYAGSVPVIDCNLVHARHAASLTKKANEAKAFKVGIVGGVGPAATVDFMNKVIKHTKAGRDQDHIKMVVEHNPQIPDRTENLISDGSDPTISLYAACKKLESQSADLIAIPCNTAHAFVKLIQPHLEIPIINMIDETIQFIKDHDKDDQKVGLLATTGTIQSHVYHSRSKTLGVTIIEPDSTHQNKVMQTIYGDKGVKAGNVEGECKENLLDAIKHLVNRGARTVILGCTELPLLISHNEAFSIADQNITVLDPTEILARKIVSLSEQSHN